MRIAIIEDDVELATLLSHRVQAWNPDADIICFESVTSALDGWRERVIDIALIDWILPDGSGIDLVRTIREWEDSHAGLARAWLIVVTAKRGRDDLAVALDAGADDFMSKPVDSVEIRARLGAGVRIATLMTALADQTARLQLLVDVDELTEAASRRAVMIELERRIAALRRRSAPFAVLMIDIDRFKVINDTHGHAEGDRVLRDLVTLLRSKLRAEDMVARLGGDEFAIVAHVADHLEFAELLARIRGGISDADGFGYSVGGCLLTDPSMLDDGDSIGAIFATADADLYGEKARA